MKKTIILTSLLAVFATNSAIAGIEGVEAGQVKTNLTTSFKTEPNKSDYAVKAPDGSDSTLNDQQDSDYTSYTATTAADGTNVKLNNGTNLNIAQDSVANTDYTYLTYASDGSSSYVAGDTAVDDLSDGYTSSTITSSLTVSTANTLESTIASIPMGSSITDATYKDNGTYYLTKDAQGNLLLNNSQSTTTDNPTVFQTLSAQYQADVAAISTKWNTLNGYKTTNQTNATAVATAVTADNQSITDIKNNRADFTSKNSTYTSNLGEYTSYNGSLAQAIDNADTTTLNTAKAYTDSETARAQAEEADIRSDFADADTTLQNNITTQITQLISDKETNMSAQLGYDVTHNPANESASGSLINSLTMNTGKESADKVSSVVGAINANTTAIDTEATTRSTADATLQANITAETTRAQATEQANATAISNEATARANADTTLQSNITAEENARIAAINAEVATRATNDAFTLASAKAYSDGNLALANNYTDAKIDDLDKDLSGGIAAATALSAVEVSNVKKGEVSVGGGYGHYNGESAGAFGAAMGLSDNWSVNVGAGIHSSNTAFRAGTNYKFKLF